MTIPNKYDTEVNELIVSAKAEVSAHFEAQITELKAQHSAEISALNALLEKAREANATADYSAYAEFPDLLELLKKTNLRPGALPSLCALQVWKGLGTAGEISLAIPTTPVLGEDGKKGGKASTAKIITSALQKLEKSLYAANTGVGIKVTSIRGPAGDSSVRKIRFHPFVEISETEVAAETETETVDVPAEQNEAA